MRQGDTKPAAKALIARFGSFAAVLDADPAALQEVKGVGEAGAAALKSVGLAARRMAKGKVSNQPVLGSWQALLDYLAIDMSNLNHERIRVLYLNTQSRLIADVQVHDGTIDEGAIYPRRSIRKGSTSAPPALILVHNHPSGIPTEPRRHCDHQQDRGGRAASGHRGPRPRDHWRRQSRQPAGEGVDLVPPRP